MNLAQRITISMAFIIMGAWTLFFAYFLASEDLGEAGTCFFLSLLGFVFIVVALLVLFHSKNRADKEE